MAFVFATYSEAQTNVELVAAQAGKLIRVLRLVFTAWGGVKMTLVSDPGADPLNLTPPLHVQGGNSLDLRLGRGFSAVVARGKALGVTTELQTGAVEHSVAVWYEVVD